MTIQQGGLAGGIAVVGEIPVVEETVPRELLSTVAAFELFGLG